MDASTALRLLSGCNNLKNLKLHYVIFGSPQTDSSSARQTPNVHSRGWVFSSLTEFALRQWEQTAVLQCLAAMPYLHSLDVTDSSGEPWPGVEHLTQFTKLKISAASLAIRSKSPSGFSQLTILQHLELSDSALDASLMRSLTELQSLEQLVVQGAT